MILTPGFCYDEAGEKEAIDGKAADSKAEHSETGDNKAIKGV